MKAVRIDAFCAADTVRVSDVPKPEPAPGEVRLRVAYAGVNPVDWKICQGAMATVFPHQFPLTLGWDAAGEMGKDGGMRGRCGLHFDDVLAVRSQGIDMADREGLLPLLAITSKPADHGVNVELQFAGGGTISLEAEAVQCHISDIDQGWPTPSRPDHGLEG